MQSRIRREGSVGLLLLAGIATLVAMILWLRNFKFNQQSYQMTVDFPSASGLQVGSAVLYRGVQVGRVVGLQAEANKVSAVLEITPAQLQMPPQLTVEPSRFGLIGEAIVDINPLQDVDPKAGDMNALSANCDSSLIICHEDQIQGVAAPQLLSTLSRLADLYGDPEFFLRFNKALENASEAAAEIAVLSRDISELTDSVGNDFTTLTANTTRITDNLESSSAEINAAVGEIKLLATNVNELVRENRTQISQTIVSIHDTSEQIRQLSTTIDQTMANLDSNLAGGELARILANAEALTEDLSTITQDLNQPENLVMIQQTLDSARATFANAQKITSDLDELTGDPEFRSNIRRLVNGLGSIVSSVELLEDQLVENAIATQSFYQAPTVILEKPAKARTSSLR